MAEPGLTLSLFYRGQFLSRGPWETPGSFLHPRHSHLQPLSGDYSARAQPASPHREADRHSLSPFSSPISPDAITLWFNLFSVFNSAGIKLKDGTGRLKSRASPWLYAC